MMRSLFSGVSGLKNHQIRMDVIGNNVANVNTLAFKASRVTFKEGFAQLLQGASRRRATRAAPTRCRSASACRSAASTPLHPGQPGDHRQTTDLAIQGDAFFVVTKGNQHFYTRAGNFKLDATAAWCATNGFAVQGRMATDGVLAGRASPTSAPGRAEDARQVDHPMASRAT